jgi:hypothetical protein
MFEKEAEKWVENNLHSTEEDYIKAFKDGAEFGYNKGFEFGVKSNEKVNQIVDNEWHYVKDGDLPKHDNEVLVLLKDETMQVDYYFSKVGWNISMNTDVIAWKEIVLPKESE